MGIVFMVEHEQDARAGRGSIKFHKFYCSVYYVSFDFSQLAGRVKTMESAGFQGTSLSD